MPTAPSIVWDLIRPSDIRNTRTGSQVTRGLMVKGLPAVIDDRFGTDPGLLVRCLGVSGFPQLGEQFPYAPWSNLVVTEQRLLDVVNKSYSARFAITYEGFLEGLDPIWTVQEDYSCSMILTSSTADGSKMIKGWYNPTDVTDMVMGDAKPIAGSTTKAMQVHKLRSGRVVRAIANMPTTSYNNRYRDNFRSVAEKINSTLWADMGRGQAYFVGPKTTTRNFGSITQCVCDFIVDPKGHYPIAIYRDRMGNHPGNCKTEQFVRSGGPPQMGDAKQANGITIASVQLEYDFNTIFADFTPLIWTAPKGT